MRLRRVLVVEDDHFQREAIAEAIEDGAPGDMKVEVVTANSEAAAEDALSQAAAEGKSFDAYVVDHHLPWAQGDKIPDPPEDVLRDGPLVAGFRVAARITGKRAALARPGAALPPIIVFTIDDGPDVLQFGDSEMRRYVLVKGEDDRELTELLFPLIG